MPDTDPQARAAEILTKHQAFDARPGIRCGHPLWSADNCNKTFSSYGEHRAHVAAELAAAGLLADLQNLQRLHTELAKTRVDRDAARTELADLRSNIKKAARQLSQMGDKDGLRVVLGLLNET